MTVSNGLGSIQHVVVLMLENRSFDHMLGFLYADRKNQSLSGEAFDGLTGNESNRDATGRTMKVFQITPQLRNPYQTPGADPGEGYLATNQQLFSQQTAPIPSIAKNDGFVTDFASTLGVGSEEPTLERRRRDPAS